jgi:superfamily I DNA and/or RNA helicase
VLGFLLMRNRLNVSISRAKWKAYLVRSPALLDHLPNTPQGLVEMSAFARLTAKGDRLSAATRGYVCASARGS